MLLQRRTKKKKRSNLKDNRYLTLQELQHYDDTRKNLSPACVKDFVSYKAASLLTPASAEPSIPTLPDAGPCYPTGLAPLVTGPGCTTK